MGKVSTPIPSEEAEQTALVAYLKKKGVLIFSIPNGVHSGKVKGSRLGLSGLLSGVPDLLAILPGPHFVFIEMKRQKGGTVSPTQKIIHRLLGLMGIDVIVGKGARDAIDKLADLADLGSMNPSIVEEVKNAYKEIDKCKAMKRSKTSSAKSSTSKRRGTPPPRHYQH